MYGGFRWGLTVVLHSCVYHLLAATVTRRAHLAVLRVAREVVQVEHQVAERKVSVHGVVVALVRTDCL